MTSSWTCRVFGMSASSSRGPHLPGRGPATSGAVGGFRRRNIPSWRALGSLAEVLNSLRRLSTGRQRPSNPSYQPRRLLAGRPPKSAGGRLSLVSSSSTHPIWEESAGSATSRPAACPAHSASTSYQPQQATRQPQQPQYQAYEPPQQQVSQRPESRAGLPDSGPIRRLRGGYGDHLGRHSLPAWQRRDDDLVHRSGPGEHQREYPAEPPPARLPASAYQIPAQHAGTAPGTDITYAG